LEFAMTKPRLPKAAAAILSRIGIENEQYLARRRTDAALVRQLKERLGETETRILDFEKARHEGRLFREVTMAGEGGAQSIVERVADESLLGAEYEERDRLKTQIVKLQASTLVPRATAVKLQSELDAFAKYVTRSASPTSMKGGLTQLRALIDVKREERKAVANASRTYEEVREAAMSSIRSLAARGCPKVLPAFQGRAIEWPMAQVPNPGSNGYAFVTDGAALVAFLFQNELERKVDSLLEFNRPDDALSAANQRAKLDAIDEELMALYREEAATVEAIVADGGNAFHLADRPAVAVLGIRLA
jgi:hypothetical protein